VLHSRRKPNAFRATWRRLSCHCGIAASFGADLFYGASAPASLTARMQATLCRETIVNEMRQLAVDDSERCPLVIPLRRPRRPRRGLHSFRLTGELSGARPSRKEGQAPNAQASELLLVRSLSVFWKKITDGQIAIAHGRSPETVRIPPPLAPAHKRACRDCRFREGPRAIPYCGRNADLLRL
jgi:hypothetical protein